MPSIPKMKEDSPQRSTTTTPNIINESHLTELLPNQLYMGCFPFVDATVHRGTRTGKNTQFVSIHDKYHYEPFYEDFGPWNLSVLYRLCKHLDKWLEIEERRGRRLVLYCQDSGNGDYEKVRVNMAYALGAYLIIYQGLSADDAYLKVSAGIDGTKMIGFRDASLGEPQYLLHVHDVLRGIEKALKHGWLDFRTFDYEDYEHYERVENGDFNWIIPGKILSFCGPHNESREENGYPYHAPNVYFDYFREKGISTIVRLNAKNYDAGKFVRAGFDHVDLFFVDGSTPSDDIIHKFLRVVDTAKGGVAVHCKAGLGRTGTLIACWMMKEFGLTAGECMGWMRVCRPGSVIGPQQMFLVEKQKMCWALSNSNGVHLVSPKKEDKKSVKKLMSQVDDIHIGGASSAPHGASSAAPSAAPTSSSVTSPVKTRPNILRRKAHVATTSSPCISAGTTSYAAVTANGTNKSRKGQIVDETALDEQGRSQGDRLLALKAKHQHEAHPAEPPRRFVKNSTPQIPLPSQAFLNRNREPITPTKPSSLAAATSSSKLRTCPNGNVAYRSKHSSGSGSSTLTRTPTSAVFPSMAFHRSEGTRYLSPTTPQKPMSPQFKEDSAFRMTLRSDRSAAANLQPQVSKCTLTTTDHKTPRRILSMPMASSKSTSSLRKIQVSRPRPYPSNGVRVELCANGKSYDIRPRKEAMSINIPGAALAANNEALLGKRKTT